jgi:hypothetical protein
MSIILEEKVPMVQNYLVEQYGRVSESAVNAVSEGIKKAVATGVASFNEDAFKNFEIQTPDAAYPDPTQLGIIINGGKVSDEGALGVPIFMNQPLERLELNQNAELSAFGKNLFGTSGSLKQMDPLLFHDVEENPLPELANRIANLMDMEVTLKKNLQLQQDMNRFNFPIMG